MTAPAGWYEDPSNVALVRFWEGCQWTAYSAPKQAGPGGFPPATQGSDNGPSNPLHYVVPIGRSWQSIWAPYLGLFSLVPVPFFGQALGAGAIVLGVLALRRARSGGHGTGRAIVGIVLGAIGAIGGAIFFLTMVANQGDGA